MPGNGAAASYGDLLITSLVVLAGVCIAAFVVVKVVGRFLATGRMRGGHLLDIVARLPLEPRRSLYVVEVAGKTLLVGTSEMGLSVLSELDGSEVKARAVPKQSFGELVRSAWLKRREQREDASDVSAETRTAHEGASSVKDVSAETRTAHEGASSVKADVSAETRTAHEGASSVKADVSAETRTAHEGASSVKADASAETRTAHEGASSAKADVSAETRMGASTAKADVSAETRGAHVGATSANDVSAETRGAHVGATDREES